MNTSIRQQRVYEALADHYDRAAQAKMRDWFLVLAADAALAAGQEADAERLRQRLLQGNPNHLLKPYRSFAEALRSPDVQGYVNDLRRTYPPRAAEELLAATNLKFALPAAPAPEREPMRRPVEKTQAQPAVVFEPRPETEPDLKVFRIQAEPEIVEAPEPPPRPTVLPRPTVRPVPTPAKPPASLPRAKPEASAPRTQPIPVARPPVESKTNRAEDSLEKTEGAALAMILFVITLIVGFAWTAYSFLRPFLPPEWFR